MAGGGGSQKSTTQGESSYPAEFRPLADSARKQIEALQAAVPLVSHANFQPAAVAGMSPIEQFAIEELVMRTPYLPPSMQGVFELPEPVGAASRGIVKSGEMTQGARGAFDVLSGLLGRDVRPPQAPAATQTFQTMTRLPMPETAFPGLSAATLERARPGIASRPTPMLTPLPPPPNVGPPQASPDELANLIAQRMQQSQPVPPGFVVVPQGFPGAGQVVPQRVWEVMATMPGISIEEASMRAGAGDQRVQGEG